MGKTKKQKKNAKRIAEQKRLRPKWYYIPLNDKLIMSIFISLVITLLYVVALGLNLNFFEEKYLNKTNLVFVCIIIGLVVWAGVNEWKLKRRSTVKLNGFLIFPKYYKSSWIIVTFVLSGISLYLATQAKSENVNTVSYSLNILAFFIFLYWNTYLSVFKRKNDKSIPSYLVALHYIVFAYVPTIASFFITIYPNMYGLIDSIKDDSSPPTNLVVLLCLLACMLFVIGEQFYLRVFNPPAA